MRPDRDPVNETDLLAYVDGQLDAVRRAEVEEHLSRHPSDAAKVMADLHARSELLLALMETGGVGDRETTAIAGRLAARLKWARRLRPLVQGAAAVLVIGAVLLVQSRFELFGVGSSLASVPPPAFVAEALESYTTSTLRNAMPSQLEVKSYERAELRAATAIAMPALPDEWIIDDVQIFPSTFGPSISVAIETDDLGRVALYAARPGTSVNLPITATGDEKVAAAFWQEDDVAYALVGSNIDHGRLMREAGRIERSLP